MNVSTAEMGSQEEPTITLVTKGWVMVNKKEETLTWSCVMTDS